MKAIISLFGISGLVWLLLTVAPRGSAQESHPPDDKTRLIWEKKVDATENPLAAFDGKLYVSGYNGIRCLNSETGEDIWRFEIKALGRFCSPAVVQKDLYVCLAMEEESLEPSLSVCLDTETGKERWRFSFPEKQKPVGGPAVGGKNIFVACKSGDVYCLDATTGKMMWESSVGNRVSCFPSVTDKEVYVGASVSVVCLNASDGKKIWEAKAPNKVESQLVVCGSNVYAGCDGGAVVCLDAKSGKTMWTFESGRDMEGAGCVLMENRLLFGNEDGKVYCLDVKTGAKLWDCILRDRCRVSGCPVVAGNQVFAFVRDGRDLSCLELSSGKPLWHIDTKSDVCGMIVYKGKLYVAKGHSVGCYALEEKAESDWPAAGGGPSRAGCVEPSAKDK